MFDLKLIAEGILRYFSNKSAFDDKLEVSCPAGVDNYLICMHCFETNACAFIYEYEYEYESLFSIKHYIQ